MFLDGRFRVFDSEVGMFLYIMHLYKHIYQFNLLVILTIVLIKKKLPRRYTIVEVNLDHTDPVFGMFSLGYQTSAPIYFLIRTDS